MAELELDTIRHALDVARSAGMGEVQIELEGTGFSAVLCRTPGVQTTSQILANGQAPEKVLEEGLKVVPISATCVGFYRPSDSVLKLGGKVGQGDIVATITALGLANDVESPVSGEIVEILAEPEQPVEFGQHLAMVREG